MTATDFERGRLAALERYCILDTDAEENFDAIARLAGSVCCAPVALISIVDGKRQWFKSRIGIDLEETARDISFCSQAIEAAGELFVIEDTRDDARFSANPLVAGPPYIRFYAGMPFRSSDGFALGTLCVIDFVPRTLSTHQFEALRTLGKQVEAQLELRKTTTRRFRELFHGRACCRPGTSRRSLWQRRGAWLGKDDGLHSFAAGAIRVPESRRTT